MNTSVSSEINTNAAVIQTYTKNGFHITISTSDISDTERKKSDILIKGKLTDLLSKSTK